MRRIIGSIVVGLATTALVVSGLAAPAQAAPTGSAPVQRVTIRVELDYDDSGTPVTLLAQNVEVTDGVELPGRASDVISNPAIFCGRASVDIRPATGTIVVKGVDDPCFYTSVTVWIFADGMHVENAVTGELIPGASFSVSGGSGVARLRWAEAEGDLGTASVPYTSDLGGALAKSAAPKITGTAKVGRTLKAWTPGWTSGVKFTYTWFANGKAISKATKSTLKVPSSAKGKKITVRVVGSKAGYAKVTRTSSATKSVKK